MLRKKIIQMLQQQEFHKISQTMAMGQENQATNYCLPSKNSQTLIFTKQVASLI